MPTTTPFQNLITFSRGSNATVTGPNGLIQWAPNNLVTHSEQIDNAAWTKGNITVVANVAAAPDGTSTADRLVPSSVNTIKFANGTPSFSTGAGQGATYSCYAKADGYSKIALRESATTGAYASFDLATASVIETGNAGGMVVSNASVTDVGNGWYRLAMTCTNPTSTGVHGFGAWPLSPSYTTGQPASLSWSGNGTSGILIWGAQLELGSTATTYNPTTVKNLLGFSEAFDNAAWTKISATVVTGTQANPVNGLFNAQKLMEDTSSAGHQVTQSATTTANPYTFSVYAKAAGRNWVALGITDSGSVVRITYFNLATGAVGIVATGITASISPVRDGWYRCSVTVGASLAGSTVCRVYLSADGTTTSYTGGGSSGAYIYGAQLSDSASLDPYVPTPGAAPSSTAYYGPRFDYDPVTRQPKGILIEEARTNLLTYSGSVGGVNWVSTHAPTLNAAVAPDGTTTMTQANPATTASQIFQIVTLTTNTAYRLSIYAQAGTSGRSKLSLYDITGADIQGELNIAWTDGVPSQFSVGGSATGATFESVGGGIYRISVTVTSDAVNTSYRFQWYSDTVLGTGTTFIWGAQLEVGAFATSYIPTIASTVTRSADVATITGSLFSQWYRQDQGTFVVNLTPIGTPPGATNTRFLEANDGSGNNRKPLLFASPAGATLSQYRVAGVDQALIQQGGTFASGVNLRVATACATDNFAASFNGGAVATDGTGSVANTCTQLTIGYATSVPAGTEIYNGHLRSIDFIPFRSANFQLETLST